MNWLLNAAGVILLVSFEVVCHLVKLLTIYALCMSYTLILFLLIPNKISKDALIEDERQVSHHT